MRNINKDLMQTAARATIFSKVEKGIRLNTCSPEMGTEENVSPTLASPEAVVQGTNLSMPSPIFDLKCPPPSPNGKFRRSSPPPPAHVKFPVAIPTTSAPSFVPGQFAQGQMYGTFQANFPTNMPTMVSVPSQFLLQQRILSQSNSATVPFSLPNTLYPGLFANGGFLQLPLNGHTKSPTSSPPNGDSIKAAAAAEQVVEQRRPVKRGRPQQAMESDTDDDPVVQKKRHRRLYARNYRAQLRDKLDVADELRKKIETLQREHENEILTIKNDHRDRMDRMKEWYMSELHKRDEMFALLLTRTATITTTSTV